MERLTKNRWKEVAAIAVAAIALCALLYTCIGGGSIPKPRGYFRIALPEKQYTKFDRDTFPYKFEYADVADIKEHKSQGDHYWVDVYYQQINATIYCSYKPVNNNLQELSEDARSFVYKHTVKADDITEQPYEDDSSKVYAMLYELRGNTATAIQFVATDSVHHFFRAALYFDNTPNQDSLAPVVSYVREDIIKMIESLRWK